jgi:pimeloyl-ACP methyl ester carboxylesterase
MTDQNDSPTEMSRRAVIGAAAALPLASALPQMAQAATTVSPGGIPITPFKIDVPQARLDYIASRLRNAEWPDKPDVEDPWAFGASYDVMKDVVDYWLNKYDWRKQEAELNKLPQFKAKIDGYEIHFFHIKGSGKNPQPIILTHGWPGSFLEYTHIAEQLAHPEKFGGKVEDAFTVVIPSIPGFGFSSKPKRPITGRTVARLLDKLMVEGLGYKSYLAEGGDYGAGISSDMASESAHCKAAQIRLVLGVGSPPQNDEERAAQAGWNKLMMVEGGYIAIQGTKPQSLAFAMNDSPLGVAAWLMEKYRGWSQTKNGDPWSIYTRDQLLNVIMVYVTTSTFGTASWMYTGGRGGGDPTVQPRRPAEKPTVAVIRHPGEFIFWPKSYGERVYNLISWKEMAAGGHFASMEQPKQFVDELRVFRRDVAAKKII